MSYDIYLKDKVTGDTLELDAPHHMRGGTYRVGGTTEAHLNVTYNYAPHYRRVFGGADIELSEFDKIFGGAETGIRRIYGLSGAESLPLLDKAIGMLGDDVDPDYWEPTEGNAKRALVQLRALAAMRPDGIWAGD